MDALLPPPSPLPPPPAASPSPPHPRHHLQRIHPQQQQLDLQHHHRQQQIDPQQQQIDDGCAEDNPRKLLRWTKNETLLLLAAKRKREDGLLILSPGADEKVSDVNKWKRICDSLRAHGVDRDHVACKKRWFHLLSDYKKIQDWQRAAGAAESFWLMQPHERRAKRLPSGFDRDIYGELDSWLGGRPAVNPSAILETTIGNGEGTLDFEVENDPLPDLSDRNGLRSYGVSETNLTCRKKRCQSIRKDADLLDQYDARDHLELRESLIHVLERNGKGMEIALRNNCQAQIDAQRQISEAQMEAQKQIIELQMQQGREFVGAMYALVGALGELAKSLRSPSD